MYLTSTTKAELPLRERQGERKQHVTMVECFCVQFYKSFTPVDSVYSC